MTESHSGGGVPASTATLTLYVSRQSVDSDRAIDNLRSAIIAHWGEQLPDVLIVDVNDSPLVAYREGIFVTPTLVVSVDGVQTSMVGNLSDPQTTRVLLERLIPHP